MFNSKQKGRWYWEEGMGYLVRREGDGPNGTILEYQDETGRCWVPKGDKIVVFKTEIEEDEDGHYIGQKRVVGDERPLPTVGDMAPDPEPIPDLEDDQ
jgi:hypothetical protein